MNALFEALLNGWWQGIVLTLLVWLVLRGIKGIGATTRLAIWQVTLLVVLLLPALQRVPLPSWRTARPIEVRATASGPAVRIAPSSDAVAQRRPVIELPQDELPGFLVAICLSLAALQLLRLALACFAVRRLKRRSTPLEMAVPADCGRRVTVGVSAHIGMPIAVGYAHPAILLPTSLTARLSDDEIRYVVLHESAHLRRRDDWMALAERFIRAVFCFQPAVHFIGRQIELEREMACDDCVIAESGEPKAYASTLAHLAELGLRGPTPMLASGAGRRKQIFARLETILDRGRNRTPTVSTTLLAIAALLLLFVASEGARFNNLLGLSPFSSRWVETSDGLRREVKMRGDVRFTEDDSDVESMSPGAMLVLERSELWRSRRVEFALDEQGKIQRRFYIGDSIRPFDAEARRFLAAELPRWVREQGVDIPAHVARMLRSKGADAALEDIRTIGSSSVKRGYLEELFNEQKLGAGQVHRALKIAGEIDSDNDKRQFFENVHEQYLSHRLDSGVWAFVDSIHSDEDRKRLLLLILNAGLDDGAALTGLCQSAAAMPSDGAKAEVLEKMATLSKKPVPGAFFDVAGTIHSDGDRARVLMAALAMHGSDPETAVRVLKSASGMNSDSDKATLVAASASNFHGEGIAHASAQVLQSIHGDGDRRRALEAVIAADGRDPETLREMLAQTAAMNGDGDKGHVLLLAAPEFPQDGAVRGAFFSAVDTIHSDGDHRQVLMAVLNRKDLTPDTLRDVSRSALLLNSAQDQATILRGIAEWGSKP